MQHFLLSLPLPLLFAVMVIGPALLAALFAWLVIRAVPSSIHQGNNIVGGQILQIIGVIFGILLGFMIPAVWGQFNDAAQHVEQEANNLIILYRLSGEMPEPTGSDLQRALSDYAELVVTKEWPAMAQSQFSPDVSRTLDRLWQIHRELKPTNEAELAVRNEMFTQLRDMSNLRRDRLFYSQSQLQPVMWLMLAGGAIITVAFSLFLRSSNDRNQVLMVAILASMIGFGLLLVMMLDLPFSGDVRITPDPFIRAQTMFGQLRGQ